jgi:hypothetical protein
MRAPTRHPRLSAVACKVYGLTIWMYPTEFRRAFGHELVVTFRNRVEDVLDGGGILDWFAFAGHIALDCVRTCSVLMTESRPRGAMSLLGLNDGDAAHGCIDRTTVDVSLVFAAAGIVCGCVVWYAMGQAW